MKHYISYGLLGIALIVLGATLYVVQQDKTKFEHKLTKTEQQLTTLSATLEEEKQVAGLQVKGAEVTFVQDFFHTYLNYDNASYTGRFDALSTMANAEVISRLKGASSLAPPVVKMKNELEKVQLYLDPTTPHHFLVYTTTNYYIDGSLVNHGNQLYEVEVSKDSDQYRIERFIMKGNMTEVDGV